MNNEIFPLQDQTSWLGYGGEVGFGRTANTTTGIVTGTLTLGETDAGAWEVMKIATVCLATMLDMQITAIERVATTVKATGRRPQHAWRPTTSTR